MRDEVKKTGIARFCDPSLVAVLPAGCDRNGAISALAALMEKNGYIENAESLVTAAIERESVLSTAMENSTAFPHVRGVEGGRLVLAMGVSKSGIDWAGDKVKIVFLSAIPVAVSNFYITLMSGIVQAYSKAETVREASRCADAKSVWEGLVKATAETVR